MKKPFSIILVFVLIFTLGSTSAFAADNPFEDQNVVLDTPSLGPGGEPISVLDTLSDVYDLLDDSFDSDDRSDVGQNSNQTDDASLETSATEYIGGDAAANANEDANRLDGNAFEGETTAFEGKSGVVTEVYDNGSVLTTNADGTKEGVDDEGTLVSVDKDGNETYHFNDGTIGIKYTNGRKEQIYEDGSKLIQNADGSMSTYEAAGYYTNLDEDGNVTSVYFENGQRIDIFDENGEFINQEVTIQGDNGETFTYKFDASENENGEYEVKEFSFSADGNGVDFHLFAKGDGNGVVSLDSKSVDGATFVMTESDGVTRVDAVSGDGVNEAHIFESVDKVSMTYKVSITFKDETGESSASEIITENGRELSIKISDGRSLTVKTDENGNVISGSQTSADGSYIKMDENGVQFSDTQTGDYFKVDKNGAITSVHMTYQSGATYDFSDGTGVLVDKENGNKVMWTHDEDGSLVIVSPESNYTVDEKGNLFKDGEPVKFNGSFVNVEKGITPDKEAPQSDETDPPQEPSETDEPAAPVETGLSSLRIAGTYSVSGYDGWEDFEDDQYTGVDHHSLTIVIEAKGENSLTIKVVGLDGTISINNYDQTTGKCSVTDTDGTVVHFSFSESGTSISFNMNYNQTFEDGRAYGSYSGTKN